MNARNTSLSRRDASYPAPPAHSRTCSFPASGCSVVSLRFGRKTLLASIVAIAGFLGAAPQGICAVVEPELLAIVPPTNGVTPHSVEAIQVLDRDPNEIVFTTWNVGADCGGGTPAAAWKLVLDPGTLLPESLELKQMLSEIQEVRGSLFESQDGELFTGGGWCGPKPPYVSIDAGETWRPANIGGDPPNSTFSFTEFMGNVYAGTGYDPYHGQVYRWIGDSTKDWNLIFDIPPPRTIVAAMTTYQGEMFVGSIIYGPGDCTGSVPVYVSADGQNFSPTAGIPACLNINDHGLVVVGDSLFALTRDDNGNLTGYRWDSGTGQWILQGPISVRLPPWHIWGPLVAYGNNLYLFGQQPGEPTGLYVSADIGRTWSLVFPWSGPNVSSLSEHAGVLYLGTQRDATGNAYIYRTPLEDVSSAELAVASAYLHFAPGVETEAGQPDEPADAGVAPMRSGKGEDVLRVRGTLGLSEESDGINPMSEPVTFSAGIHTVEIPEGSFRWWPKAEAYGYAGDYNGGRVWILLKEPSGDDDTWAYRAGFKGVDNSGTSNPITVKLSVGDDSGETEVDLFGTLRYVAP